MRMEVSPCAITFKTSLLAMASKQQRVKYSYHGYFAKTVGSSFGKVKQLYIFFSTMMFTLYRVQEPHKVAGNRIRETDYVDKPFFVTSIMC